MWEGKAVLQHLQACTQPCPGVWVSGCTWSSYHLQGLECCLQWQQRGPAGSGDNSAELEHLFELSILNATYKYNQACTSGFPGEGRKTH